MDATKQFSVIGAINFSNELIEIKMHKVDEHTHIW